MKHKVYIDSTTIARPGDIIQAGIEWLGQYEAIRHKTVFIKPNFTFPTFKPGVMTTVEALESMLGILRDCNCKIIFGEADSGGYNPFSMDIVFRKMNLHDLAERYDAQLVNLSRLPQKQHLFYYKDREHVFHYAAMFDDIDMTISMPVPKIHMNTGLSLAFKNLWGCISHPQDRLRLHHIFPHAVMEISRICKLGFCVIDGTYGLNRSGPLDGDPIPLKWLIISASPGAACNICGHLLGLDILTFAPHFKYLKQHGLIPDLNNIETNQHDLAEFRHHTPFYLKRKFTDYPGLLAFNSHSLTRLAYFSALSECLHKWLNIIRRPFYNYEHPEDTH